MRISTKNIYDSGVASMLKQQQALMHTQQQIASGKKILTAADDPVGAARAIDVSQSLATNTQYAANRAAAKHALGLAENALQGVTNILQNAREVAVNAGSGALSDSDRASLAQELAAYRDELVGLANSGDGEGGYLFSGFQSAAPAFVQGAGGVQYQGDQGRRLLQVSASRQLAVSESGREVFENLRAGRGGFVAAADPANAGAGVIGPAALTGAAAPTGDAYRIDFHVLGGVTTYDVLDTTTAATVSSGNAYSAGSAIGFAGLQVTISGAPADGDRFTVAPAPRQSMFDTLDQLIATLQTSAAGTAGRARVANGISAALSNLDGALDHVLEVRAGAGSRLKEIDSLDAEGGDLDLQYQQLLSQIQDLDYASAVSELNRQQTVLEAAQKSFLGLVNSSLFDYL